MTRIYNDKKNLDYDNVRDFFKARSDRIAELGMLTVTMYQDEELATKRDVYEKDVIVPLLGLTKDSRVLDIGSGTGRWGHYLADSVGEYLGTDFCEPYVDAAQAVFDAKNYDPAKFRFKHLAATEISETSLGSGAHFNVFIIAGLMAFLNDEDALGLLRTLPKLAESKSVLYVREPVGTDARLTLTEHYSNELELNYNAIYRTAGEYEELLRQALEGYNIRITKSGPLYPPELSNRADTYQHVFIVVIG